MIEKGQNFRNGTLLLAELLKTDINGATGRITFTSEGDRLSGFNIKQFNATTYTTVGKWDSINGVQINGQLVIKTTIQLKFIRV